MRKIKKVWREKAEHYAASCWHTAEYRYWCGQDATKREIAETAARQYRCELNNAFRRYLEHPRSKKAQQGIFDAARQIGSIGLYLLELDKQTQA